MSLQTNEYVFIMALKSYMDSTDRTLKREYKVKNVQNKLG